MKVQKKIMMCIVMLLSASVTCFADGYIRGKVIGAESGRPMDLVNIFALDNENRLIASAFTDESGSFRLYLREKEKKTLKLKFCYIGYDTMEQTVVFEGKDMAVETVALLPSTENIEGAVIEARPIVRREADRIVYDVSADPEARLTNIANILKKIPDLESSVLHNGNLTYRDVPVAQILVDDEINGLVNSARQYPMRFIQGSYMAQVELILPGSPEYGNEKPILKIKLAAPFPVGAAASISAEADVRGHYSPGVDAVFNTPVIGVGLRYGFDFNKPQALADFYRKDILREDIPYDRSENESVRNSLSRSHRLGMNLFRTFGHKINFALTVSTSRTDVANDNSSWTRLYSDGKILEESSSDIASTSLAPFRFNGGLSLSQKWGKKDLNSWSVKYVYSDSHRESLQSTVSSGIDESIRERDGLDVSRQHNAEFDFMYRDPKHSYPMWKLRLRAGYYHRTYIDSQTYRLKTEDGFVSETERDNSLYYVQQVGFVKATFDGSLLDRKLRYAVSLLVEDLDNKGTLNNGGFVSGISYNDWSFVPTASISYRLKRHSFSANYYTFAKRPQISQLASSVDDSNPNYITKGNPDLKGELRNTVSVSYSYSPAVKAINYISVAYGYNFSDNEIRRITYVDENAVSVNTYANIGHSDGHTLSATLSMNPFNGFRLHVDGRCTWSDYTLPDGNVTRQNNFSLGALAGYSIKGYRMDASFSLRPYVADVQSKKLPVYPNLRFTFGKFFEKINLGFNVLFDDLIHSSSQVESIIHGTGFTEYRNRQSLGRNVLVSVYWHIGKFRKQSDVEVKAYDM